MENTKFVITDEMRSFVKENEKQFSSQYLDTMRYAWINFCNKFSTKGNFDMWGNPDGDMSLLYVCNIKWLTIIIEWAVWFDNWEEFLDCINDMENYILYLEKSLYSNN